MKKYVIHCRLISSPQSRVIIREIWAEDSESAAKHVEKFCFEVSIYEDN